METIPLLGMGTWGMGGKYERDASNIEESILALRFGLDLGINLIDVAELYGEGLTEEIVGKAIAGRDRRDIYIISKAWKDNLNYEGVLNAAQKSLVRLGTDYIDLYMIHWPNPKIPMKETIEAMEYLFHQGLIKAIGVSNFTVSYLKEAAKHLTDTNIVSNQIEYNLNARNAEKEIIPYCKKNNIHLIGYRPFAKGTLTHNTNHVVQELAIAYKKTPNQILLNWIISQGITVIPKSSNIDHLKENAGALGWNLSDADIEKLRNTTLLEK